MLTEETRELREIQNELATSGRALIFLNPLPNRRKAKLLAALEHALVQEGSTWHRFETFAQLERTVAAVETLLPARNVLTAWWCLVAMARYTKQSML